MYFHATEIITLFLCFIGIRVEIGLQYPFLVVKGDYMWRFFGWGRKKRGPVSQLVWHDKWW